MLDFVFILLIFFEIIFVAFCVSKIIKAEKKIKQLNDRMILDSQIILEANKKFKNVIQKTNKVVSIITNKKFVQIRKIIKISIDIIQVVILIRSLNFSKGFKTINYSNLKKLFLAQATQQVIKKIITSIEKMCAC